MTDNNTPGPQQASEQRFSIEKIYVKDASLESPNVPAIFTAKWEPEINLQLGSETKKVDDGVYETVLTITITAKLGEKTAYLVEIKQAGVFTISGFEDAELAPLINSYCPSTLYPFAREAINNLVEKGGFPPLYLVPINFDAMWAQRQQEVARAQARAASSAQVQVSH